MLFAHNASISTSHKGDDRRHARIKQQIFEECQRNLAGLGHVLYRTAPRNQHSIYLLLRKTRSGHRPPLLSQLSAVYVLTVWPRRLA